MPSYKTEAIILKRTNFGEADRIITVFSKQRGKLKILAKGVRRLTSRRAGSVELFNQATLFLHQGRTFDILTEAQALNTFALLRGDLELVGMAYYGCELVDRLTPEDQAHEEVYELLIKLLEWLDTLPQPGLRKEALLRFEKALLTRLGYWSEGMEGRVDPELFLKELIGGEVRSEKFLSLNFGHDPATH